MKLKSIISKAKDSYEVAKLRQELEEAYERIEELERPVMDLYAEINRLAEVREELLMLAIFIKEKI